MAWRTPMSARLFVLGLLAITACPPFGPFFSELRIVQSVLATGEHFAGAIFLGCMLLAFIGMSRLVFTIVDGRPHAAARRTGDAFREAVGIVAPPWGFLGGSLLVGLVTPPVLHEAWTAAARLLGGNS